MCGIVLVGSSTFLSLTEVSLFENLLYMDVIRGVHGTGVIAGYHFSDTKLNYAISGKSAEASPAFMASDTWSSIKQQEYKTTINTVAKKNPYFLVGHNRHATCGAKTAENAHPFVNGPVTLVHNGTLKNQSLLPNDKPYEVDSENICYSINAIGAAETIQKLNGAFTLIWHDDRDKTLNIIRNEQRPFHLAKSYSGTWFGASEEEMLMWMLTRDDKYSFTKSSPRIEKHFECEVGVQYVFDVSNGSFTLKEEIKHELPTFPEPNRYNYSYGGYGYGYGYGYSRQDETKTDRKKTENRLETVYNGVLEDLGIKERLNDKIWFESACFDAYYNYKDRGKLVGYLPDIATYVEVHSHSFPKDKYIQFAKYQGVIVSAYEFRGIVTIVVKDATTEPEEEIEKDVLLIEPPKDSDEDDGEAQHVLMEDSELYSKEEWTNSSCSTCCNCNTSIPFDEAEEARSVSGGYICYGCAEDLEREAMLEEALDDDAPFRHDFGCTMCGQEKPHTEESHQTGICTPCYASFYKFDEEVFKASTRAVPLDNGMFVSEKEWKKMNTCIQCGNKIEFSDADLCSVREDGVLCLHCVLD